VNEEKCEGKKRGSFHSFLHTLSKLEGVKDVNGFWAELVCGARSTYRTFLEVFDLDGNPVIRYHLDGRRPVYFAVDEETFTLYGTGDDGDPEDYLLVYKLKGLS
jgi:hypothetical protein